MCTEHLDIPNCPKCKDRHRYKLNVERSIIMTWVTQSNMSEQSRQVKITRLFTCPTKNEEFQASFILTDTSSSRIKNVNVIGICQ